MVKIFDLIPSIGNIEALLNLQNDPDNFVIREVDDMVLIRYKRDITDMDNKLTKYLRGIIVDKNTLDILFYGLDKGIDYDEFKELNNDFNITIEESVDGTMINLFYYNDSWRVSTKTMINAADSKYYSQRSFLDLFMEAKGEFNFDSLNKRCSYTFVLVHPENRIVVKYNKSELVHINTRNMDTLELVNDLFGCIARAGCDTVADVACCQYYSSLKHLF